MPAGGLFCSQTSLGFFLSRVMDVEGSVMIQTVCNKLNVLVVAVSWCRQISIKVVGQILYMFLVH